MRWAVLALLLCAATKPPDTLTMSPEQQRVVGLHTTRAVLKPILEPVEVPGTVAFDPDRVAILRAAAASRVLRLRAGPGDTVRSGQTMIELAVPGLLDAEAKLTATRASVREAEAAVTAARLALQRGVVLANEGSLARAVPEQRRVLLAQQTAGAAAARANLVAEQAEIARLDPSPVPGIAALAPPIGGTIVSIDASPGEWLDAGAKIAELADLSTVLVLAQLTEQQAALVAQGDPAEIRLADGSRVWRGRVAALGAAVDPRSRTLPARIMVQNPDHAMRGGMFVAVTITSNRGRQGVTVPADAVQRIGDEQVAFAPVGNDQFRRRNLKLGVQQPDWVEVRTGLASGEAVVTQGSFTLKAMLEKALLGGAG